jgi:hypothetical protein
MIARCIKFLFGNARRAEPRRVPTRRTPSFELLEDRRVLAILWANQSTHNFESVYGATNAALAEAMVVRAIDDWNKYEMFHPL